MAVEQMVLSATEVSRKFKPCSVLGITTPTRNLVGCPTKVVTVWMLKILPRFRGTAFGLSGPDSDPVTPFLTTHFLGADSRYPASAETRETVY